MARTVEGAQAVPAEAQMIPPGIDIDNIPGEAPATQAQAQDSGKKREYKYEPSAKTLQKLDEFKFWPQVKERFGLDIAELKKNADRYGLLEGLAYGNFTTEPVFLKIKAENQKTIKGYFTVRLYTNPETHDWGIETHRVALKYKKDKDGNFVRNDKGEIMMTFDRNELKEGDAVMYDGRYLSKEDTDHLRLTGCLGKVLQSVKFNGDPVMTLLCPDPWNQHEVIGLSVDTVRKRLFTANGRIFKDDGLTFEPSDKQLGEIAFGKVVEVAAKEDPSKKRFLMYDTAQGGMRKTVSYEYALKKELARKESEALGRKLVKEQTQTQSQSQAPSPSKSSKGGH